MSNGLDSRIGKGLAPAVHVRDLGRILIITGIVIAAVGVALTAGLGRLPGDIVYKRGGFSFYFPLMTSLVLSILLTLIFWLFRR